MKSELISKFSNVYIMLLYSIMTEDMERVKHFLTDELYNKYKGIVDNNIKNNEIQMYDELNVAKINIISEKIIDNKEVVTVKLISKYMDYIVDKQTGGYKRGNNTSRVENTNILVFEKKLDVKDKNNIFKCPNCGASLDINFMGKCPYCKMVVNLTNYDYILTSITINKKI